MFQDRRWLASVGLRNGKLVYTRQPPEVDGSPPTSYQELLEESKMIFKEAAEVRKTSGMNNNFQHCSNLEFEHILF